MSFLYVFNLSNIDTLQYRNIAFICCKKNNEFSLLKVGGITDKLNKKNIFDKILKKDEIFIYDEVYNDMIKNLKKYSQCCLHSSKGGFYATIDNKIWRLGNMEGDKIIEYKLFFTL